MGRNHSDCQPTVRKIGVSPPTMSEETARRQNSWDRAHAERDAKKQAMADINKLAKERRERLERQAKRSQPTPRSTQSPRNTIPRKVERGVPSRCCLFSFY